MVPGESMIPSDEVFRNLWFFAIHIQSPWQGFARIRFLILFCVSLAASVEGFQCLVGGFNMFQI